MFAVVNNPLAQPAVKALYPHITIETHLASRHLAHVVARVLYGKRTTAENPLSVRYGYEFDAAANTVHFINVVHEPQSAPGKDWREIGLSSFLSKYKVSAKAYVNDKTKSAALFWWGRSEPRYVLAAFPRLTPWFFKERPATDWEKAFVFSLLNQDDAAFRHLINEYLQTENLESKLKSAQLGAFLDGLLTRKTQSLTIRAAEICRSIAHLEDQIRTLMAEQTEVSNSILGARAGHNSDAIDDFKAAFLANPHCHLLSAEETCLIFGVKGFITNFSEPLYLNVSRELRSVLYGRDTAYDKNIVHAAYDELFLGERYQIQVYGVVELDLQNNTVRLIQIRGGATWQRNAIPNPHMVYYRCMGGFGALYNEALRAGNYADIIDIAMSEVRNINWADTTVVSHFAHDFVDFGDYPCIWDRQEKEFITPDALLKRKELERSGNTGS